MSNKQIIITDHQYDLLGGEYLQAVSAEFTFEKHKDKVHLFVEGIEGVFYIDTKDIKDLSRWLDV